MELVYRSSVNRWECDENDHMNVRFYVQKHVEALQSGLQQHSHVTPALASSMRVQHLRFLKESRLAAPLSGFFAVVGVGQATPQLLTELRHSSTDEVLCTCLHELPLDSLEPTESLPSYAAPRGILRPLLGEQLPDDLAARGFQPIGMGYIDTADVTPEGDLYLHHYMGRVSDGMPHLWALLRGKTDAAAAAEGGAVLEYRLHYRRPLRVGQRYTIWSGVAEVGAKTMRMVHVLKNDQGTVCLTSETVGVRMDLQSRRAIAFDEPAQAAMRARAVTLD